MYVLSWFKFILVAMGFSAIVMVPNRLEADAPRTTRRLAFKLEQLASWKDPPMIRVCYNLPEFKYRVDRALMFWRYLGYEFGEVVYEDASEWCVGKVRRMDGSITLMPNRRYLGDGIYAITTRHTEKKRIIGVRVEISRMGYGEDLLIEHEIGHAMGWTHSPQPGHIMYPYLKQSGTSSDGLKKR
jgi:hypothetical protein